MRKILSLSIFFLLCLTAGAEDFTYEYEGHTLTYTVIDEEARTCKLKAGEVPVYTKDTPGNDVSGDVVIPSEAKYYRHYLKVIEIPTAAFSGCSGITSVTIPDGITSIGYHAFSNCTGLTSVTIPNSVTDIGGDAFAGCTGLTSVTISNNVTSIGNGAFYICRSLTEVTIPNSVKSIGNLAFDGCSGLRSVTISNSLTAIGIKVFNGCSSLTSVTIPQSVTSIGNYAFDGCTDLKEVYILNSTPPSADRSSFDEQNYKNATLYVPEEAYETYDNMTVGPWKYFLKLKSIETPTFYFDYDDNNMTATITGVNKDKLSSELVIPQTITYLGKTYTVVAIGEEAFKDCSGLTSVTIPNSITAIGYGAFWSCSSLTKVNISDVEAWCNIKFNNTYSNPLSYAHHLYLNGEEVTNLVLPNNVTSIGDYAFYGCSGLTLVHIPYGVTVIGSYAFSNCGLTSVQIPNSVTSMGDYVFWDCSNLTEATLPNGITFINCSFYNCGSLASVNIPNSVTAIDCKAFYNCKSLTSVIIPNRVTAIGDDAFLFTGLTEVYSLNPTPPNSSVDNEPFDDMIYQRATLYVPQEALEKYKNAKRWKNFQNIQSIESSALYFDYDDDNMTATVTGANIEKLLSNIVIPETVTHLGKTYTVVAIGDGTFYACYNLNSVTIPNSVTYIGNDAFADCGDLFSVNIPNNVTYIGNWAFSRCQLHSVNIPNSVTYLGNNAFYKCTELTSVTLPNSITSINDFTFSVCEYLTSVTIPNSVTSIGDNAFCYCGLTSITIPNSVTFIDDKAFFECRGLTEVYSLNLTPPSTGTDKDPFDDRIYKEVTLYVPEEALEAYRNADGWKNFKNIKGFDPTGINGIEADGKDRRDVYYDLNGHRLSAPRKGLNIINGKKVIVK